MIDVALTDVDDVARLTADWRGLYPQAEHQSFFLSPQWFEAWLGGSPGRAHLCRLDAKVDGALVLLGVFTQAPRRPPVVGLREIWLHEFGDGARDAVYVEYNDLLVKENQPAEIRIAAIGELLDAPPDADGFVFRNLRPELTDAVKVCAVTRGLNLRTLREQPVYVCKLGGGDFVSGLSKSLRTKIRRSMKLYEERGGLTARLAQTPAQWDAAWASLRSLHAAGWSARGQASVFDNPHLIAFHERLKASAADALHLFEVKAGDQTIAVLYNFIHGKRVMNYQCGFLFEDDNRLAPGFVAHAMAAQFYQDAGFEVYDLLAGEADYKQRLGAAQTTLTSLAVERRGWRWRLRSLIRG